MPGCTAAGPGDLYVIIRTGDHPVFRRDGDDIHLTVPVTATEAALGAKIEVPTIDGRTLLKIPPGTQSGQKLRLREKGVPSATKEGVRGDEIVEVKITVPMPRDERTKELLRELAKLESGRSAGGVVEGSLGSSPRDRGTSWSWNEKLEQPVSVFGLGDHPGRARPSLQL